MSETATRFRVAQQVGRVPSMIVPLDREQEQRYQRLLETALLIDLHEHPFVLPESMVDLPAYFRSNAWTWGFEAVRAGGWTAVGTATGLTSSAKGSDSSFGSFADLVDELGLMYAALARRDDVVTIRTVDDLVRAKQLGRVGFLPTAEHLAIGHELHRIDVLYGLGVRLAGLTYARANMIGDGQAERRNGGLTEFGREVVRRMNDLGMVVDLSHAGNRTALDAIERSSVACVFSHNAAKALRPTQRCRTDEELLACAQKGGLIGITAVPNSLSDDPHQDINCVLDHFDYMVKLVGIDHVAIGTDTLVGDHVGMTQAFLPPGTTRQAPAPYLNGLESPADGKNIVRGLIARGYGDDAIAKIAGGNIVDLLRRVMG